MKKHWKIFWIVCGVLLFSGILCCVVSWGFGTTIQDIANRFSEKAEYVYQEKDDWDDDDRDDRDEKDDWDDDDQDDENDDWDDDDRDGSSLRDEGKQESILEGNGAMTYQNIRRIKSSLYAGRVNIQSRTDTDEITVESKGLSGRLGFKAFEKEGTLYLTSNKKIKNTNNIGKGTITITIPQDRQFEEVELNLKAGELKADQILAKHMEVNAGAGEVSILDFETEKAEFQCGAGTVGATGDVTRKIEADCGVGEIDLKLKGNKEDYNYDMECGIGEITCGDESYSGFGKDLSIDNQASKEMEIDCGIGQITIKYLDQM